MNTIPSNGSLAATAAGPAAGARTAQPPTQQPHKRVGSSSTSGGSANTLADLLACTRRCTGTVPPALVGFSSTVIGDKLYVFGGRLVRVRQMVSSLFALDLQTLVWEQLWPRDDIDGQPSCISDGPQPRYFHSADAWGTKLVIFGGMGQTLDEQGHPRQDSGQTENGGSDPNLSVMSDVLVFDTVTGEWSYPQTTVRAGIDAPLARYAHLSAISNGCLVILGGQDILNRYIEQLSCLELDSMTYVQNSEWKGHAGTYRSVAVSRTTSVHPGGAAGHGANANGNGRDRGYSTGTYDSSNTAMSNSVLDEGLQLPYSIPATPEEGVYHYSNYNFAEVRRALDLISAPSAPDWRSSVTSLSDLMTGTPSLPPGLRFPTASMVGSHLVLTGTLITQQVSSFAIWTLDLSKATHSSDVADAPKLTWVKIDAGHALKSGSWNRAVAWRNSVVILGDRDRDIAVDYNRRQNNFTHVVYVDLEMFGIYQPPPQTLPLATQEFGLSILNQPMLSDFDVICSDDVRLPCSRKVLEDNWPWFKTELEASIARIEDGLPLVDASSASNGTSAGVSNGTAERRVDLRQLYLPENSTVGLAILQYFYSHNLITPLQHLTPVLVSMLIFAREYELENLRALVVHALHGLLSSNPASAATVYEAAALAGCIALQARALKMMMNANPRAKHRPAAIDTARRQA